MFRKSPWIAAALAIAVIPCAPPVAQCDTITVTARDLKSTPFSPGTQIQLRVMKQITAANGAVSMGRQIGPTLTQTAAAGSDVIFTVNVDVNNPVLTNGEPDPDRTILLILSRGGIDTATVQFITIGSITVDAMNNPLTANNLATPHQLNVGVPEPPTAAPPCCPVECPPPCCRTDTYHGGRCRLFRR
jgi:hypothetical protein